MSGWGGKREGGGRPKGAQNEATRIRLEAERKMKARIVGNTDRLINTQLQLATGESNLYVKRAIRNEKGTVIREEVDMITNSDVIISYLNGEYDDQADEYYYIATKSPNLKATENLLDRAYGKAQQSIDHTSAGKPLPQPIMGGSSVIQAKEEDDAERDIQED